MLDALPALVAYVDRDLVYRYANARHLDWTGRQGSLFVGRPLWERMEPELRATMEPLVARAQAGERSEIEFALPQSFGRRFVRLMVAPDRDEDGTIAGIVFLATDTTRRHDLEEELRRSKATMHQAFHAAAVGKALVDTDGGCMVVNAAFAKMLGYDVAELQGVNFAVFTHPEDLGTDLDQFEAVKRGERDGYEIEKRYLHRDGGTVHAQLSVTTVRDDAGAILFFVSQIVDISERKAAEQQLRDSNAQLRLALDVLDGGMWQFDIASGLVEMSAGLARLTGLAPRVPAPVEAFEAAIHREDRAGAAITAFALGDEERGSALYRLSDPRGGRRWMRCRRQLIRDDAGQAVRVLGVAVDVTEERATEARLAREATTDPLTGLLNRRGFDAAAEQVLRTRGENGAVALLLLDLDRFKPINDGFGHAAGDKVLREVARRVGGQVRATDVVARLGGDEFAVLIGCADRGNAERAAQRIVATLAVPYRAGDVTVAATVSIGVALVRADEGVARLFERADAALYKVKGSGRGAWAMAA